MATWEPLFTPFSTSQNLKENGPPGERRHLDRDDYAFADGTGEIAHVNLIARDWQRLAQVYTTVFGCALAPPERDFQDKDLDAGTGIHGGHLRGAHLRLPVSGDQGPTLEIFSYDQLEPASPAAANRPGYGHIAFEVEDVAAARQQVLSAGGGAVGEIVTLTTAARTNVKRCYVTDPEVGRARPVIRCSNLFFNP